MPNIDIPALFEALERRAQLTPALDAAWQACLDAAAAIREAGGEASTYCGGAHTGSPLVYRTDTECAYAAYGGRPGEPEVRPDLAEALRTADRAHRRAVAALGAVERDIRRATEGGG